MNLLDVAQPHPGGNEAANSLSTHTIAKTERQRDTNTGTYSLQALQTDALVGRVLVDEHQQRPLHRSALNRLGAKKRAHKLV